MNIYDLVLKEVGISKINDYLEKNVAPNLYEVFEGYKFNTDDVEENTQTFVEEMLSIADNLIGEIDKAKDLQSISLDNLEVAISFLTMIKKGVLEDSVVEVEVNNG